jgi:hypothetical protein
MWSYKQYVILYGSSKSKQYVILYGSSKSSGDVSFRIKSDEQVHELLQTNIEKGVVHIDA